MWSKFVTCGVHNVHTSFPIIINKPTTTTAVSESGEEVFDKEETCILIRNFLFLVNIQNIDNLGVTCFFLPFPSQQQ